MEDPISSKTDLQKIKSPSISEADISVAGSFAIDAAVERSVVRKLDFRYHHPYQSDSYDIFLTVNPDYSQFWLLCTSSTILIAPI